MQRAQELKMTWKRDRDGSLVAAWYGVRRHSFKASKDTGHGCVLIVKSVLNGR